MQGMSTPPPPSSLLGVSEEVEDPSYFGATQKDGVRPIEPPVLKHERGLTDGSIGAEPRYVFFVFFNLLRHPRLKNDNNVI